MNHLRPTPRSVHAAVLPARHLRLFAALLFLNIVLVARPAAALDALPVDESIARQAYQLADAWVTRLEVPADVPPMHAASVAGVHVTLRRAGLMLAQSTVTNPDPAQPVDVMSLVARATREAIASSRAAARPASDDAPLAPIILDLQIAHHLEPLRVEKLDELLNHLRVGVHGLALKHGDAWAWLYPANALATNATLVSQINRLLAELKLPLEYLRIVGTKNGPPLYRFDVIHIVRPAPGQPMLVLYRGNDLLPPAPLDEAAIARLHAQLLHTVTRRQRADGRFAGAYEPTADQYSTAVAKPFEAALATLALARTARLAGLDDKQRQPLAHAARISLEQLLPDATGDALGNIKPTAPVGDLNTIAMTLWALTETPGTAALKPQRLRLDTILRGLQNPTGFFRANTSPAARPATAAGQAIASIALLRLYDQVRDPAGLTAARRALEATWKQLTDEQAISALPWLAYAEIELARLDQPSPHHERLKKMLADLWRRQVQPPRGDEASPPAPDAIGGFLIASLPGDEPTWQSAEVLAAQALALRPGVGLVSTPQQPMWLVNSALAARFLAQLTLQPANCFYVRNPGEAVGAVRLSLSNNRQPLEASATALLALTELQHTLDALAGKVAKE